MQAQILAPAALLVVWSLVMLMWLAASRFPAMAKVGVDTGAKPGGRGQDLEGVLPDAVNWKSHNYTHLMEQPTIFYAAVTILAIMGADAYDVMAAWIYVGLRIAHSLWQATVNSIPIRLMIFSFASIALVVLAVRALMVTLFAAPVV